MTLIDPATDIPPPIGVDPRHPDQEDTALAALAALIGLQGVSVDAAQLRHNLGHARAPNGADLVRLARQVPGIRAKYLTGQSGKMDRLPLPVMARRRWRRCAVAIVPRRAALLPADAAR